MTDIFETPEESEIPVFHPVWERSPGSWFPGNETTAALIIARHIWEDIQSLIGMHDSSKEEYERKLLLRYLFLELHSLLEVMDKIQAAIMIAETYEEGTKPLYRGISTGEKETAKELWQKYAAEKKAVQRDITDIRNKIVAHRTVTYDENKKKGAAGWNSMMSLFDKLDLGQLKGLLASIPPAFEHAKGLNIYEWNRQDEGGSISFIGSPVYPGQFLQENENDII